tara:strand:- start:2989 stop:4887 length:1899 start_codon:yes stop_codon:yes gene_type:complete
MGLFNLLPPAIAVKDIAFAEEVVNRLQDNKILAFDTETTGLSRSRDKAVILAISDGEDRWAIWPQCFHIFKPLLENPELKLVAHNANYDAWMLRNVGIDIYRHASRCHYRMYDTMVMHALVDDQAKHDLKSLSKEYLGIEMVPFKQVFGSLMRKYALHELLLDPENEEVVCNYASLDAYATYHLAIALMEELKGSVIEGMEDPVYSDLWSYYICTEVPFTRVLFEMELNGIEASKEELLQQAPEMEQKRLDIQKWFGRKTQRLFINLNSTAEMGDIFFGQLGKRPLSHTQEGKPQLNKSSLDTWARDGCEYAEKLLEYRDLDKKLGTYITNLLGHIYKDGRVHATFNQTGARTGRLSSSDPNMQNQPGYIRSIFKPANGYRLLAADYAQLEMRVLAHFSKDETLIDAIKSGQDVHTATAAQMFKVPYESIMEARRKDDNDEELSSSDKELLQFRKGAKAINFGLMYGQGAGALSGTLNCSLDEARGLIRQYFRSFPRITEYFNVAIDQAFKDGFSKTILGRRRQLPGIRSSIKSERAQAERQVKNSPIQGTAADITKLAMIRLYEDDFIHNLGVKLLLQIHDEVVMEVPDHVVENDDFNNRVVDLMMHPFTFDLAVPLETSSKYGDNWLECK